MKLTLHERLMLPGLLPREGNYLTLKTANDAHNAIILTDAEQDEFEIKQDGDQITWNPKKVRDVDIELTPRAIVMIEEQLKKLNEDGKLTPQHISLYEKFVEGKKD